MKPPSPRVATVLISRRVRTGQALAFEHQIAELLAAAAGFPGHLGAQLVHPVDEAGLDSNLYHVVLAYRTQADLEAWQRSPQRREGIAKLDALTEGQPLIRPVSGLDLWFATPAAAPPPRWKIGVVTWLGIFPTVLLFSYLLGDWLAPWPLLPRIFVLSVLIVAAMNWLIAPRLTRLFRHWLHAPPRRQRS